MGGSFHFEHALSWRSFTSGTAELTARYLRERLKEVPVFAWMWDERRWKVAWALECWRFIDTPPRELRMMRSLISERMSELQGVTEDPLNGKRSLLWHDLFRLVAVIDARIDRIERHGSLIPLGATISFRDEIFWESTRAGVKAVQRYMMMHADAHDQFQIEVKRGEPHLDDDETSISLAYLSVDGLLALKRLVHQLVTELDVFVRDWLPCERAAFANQLQILPAVIDARIDRKRELFDLLPILKEKKWGQRAGWVD